nr:T9SS type A sorting domain-containing protein [Prolixibacteraceae bacterium]
QLAWMDDEIKNCDSKWIFFFTHVNILSTGFHAQWSENQKKFVLPLLEKYAEQGKHILVIGGHEHNFEHLYKNGINHIRAGAANVILRDQYTLKDMPYSRFFKNTPGYSTFDIEDDGNRVVLQARDTSGAVFYSAQFDARENCKPALWLTEPNGLNDSTSTFFRIEWIDSDPDNQAKIALYYTSDTVLTGNGIPITDTLSEDRNENFYPWNVGDIPPGSYSIFATISDSINPTDTVFSKGRLTVLPDTVPPLSALNLQGDYRRNAIHFTWENPEKGTPFETVLADFEEGFDHFIGTANGSLISPFGRPIPIDTLQITEGNTGKALRIPYTISSAGGVYAGIQVLQDFPVFRDAKFLTFFYRGDGAGHSFQVIFRQDNDRNGTIDDYWCSESVSLQNMEWEQMVIPLDDLVPYPRHPNFKAAFDRENLVTIDYVIQASCPDTGFVDIDRVVLSGEIPDVPDFYDVGLFRRQDRFPVEWGDGTRIYCGNAEMCIDSSLASGHCYYYTLFTRDYVLNCAEPDHSAFWESGLLSGHNSYSERGKSLLKQNVPNPFARSTTIGFQIIEPGEVKIEVYNLLGSHVATVLDGSFEAGEHRIVFDPEAFRIHKPGIYFYRLNTGGFVETKKMIFQ